MADFDLSKITGREPPLVTDDERDAEIAYLSDVVANRDRELAGLRQQVAAETLARQIAVKGQGDLLVANDALRARVAELEAERASLLEAAQKSRERAARLELKHGRLVQSAGSGNV